MSRNEWPEIAAIYEKERNVALAEIAELRRVGQMLASNLEGWVKTGKWEHTPLSTLAAWKEITNAVPANKG